MTAVNGQTGHMDLYELLGIGRQALDVEVRRAYRNLITRIHPDKGGNLDTFRAVQRAYEVLSDPGKRKVYDDTGKVQRTPDEEFMESFAGGSFRDRMKNGDVIEDVNVADQIVTRQSADFQSHTARFEAWMRSRGNSTSTIVTADTIADQFGVVKTSYEAVALAPSSAVTVKCRGAGEVPDVLQLDSEPLPEVLEWREVVLEMLYAPINPADLYSARTGGTYADAKVDAPFVCGHDGVGVVTKVGPGVRGLAEGDLVLTLRPFSGTWRSAAVMREPDLLRVSPSATMPPEWLALARELCTAYRLLEDHGSLKPGDCIILNAANSCVGQCVVQLCARLKLRCVALLRPGPHFERSAKMLQNLGASEVLKDEGSIKGQLEAARFLAKPRLALDAVGGEASARLADCLAEGGELVVYGCMSGRAPCWPWQAWVFKGLKVSGFNVRKWMSEHRDRVLSQLEALARLRAANMLTLNYTEYNFELEFNEALEHAMASGKDTKILLSMSAGTRPGHSPP